ncbi:mitochondrial carrier [Xylaria telfairii]|nr:mitochondrial carrier [Xylaria telfairii]
MSADFWAGYISGAAGIIVGNPLDVMKVRLQAQQTPSSQSNFPLKASLGAGVAAPILGYGFINAILYDVYARTEEILNRSLQPSTSPHDGRISNLSAGGDNGTSSNLSSIWLAGAAGGLAIWIVSTPTELIKCQAQAPSSPTTQTYPPSSSWGITCAILRAEGIRGLYRGGVVTALRDSIGYGFYFGAYKLSERILSANLTSWPASADNGNNNGEEWMQKAAKVLLSGGIAGVVSWVSIYPLDLIKTLVQKQPPLDMAAAPLSGTANRKGAAQLAKELYREKGMLAFSRGLGLCSLRAFVVNAVQWGVYEVAMLHLFQSKAGRGEELHY